MHAQFFRRITAVLAVLMLMSVVVEGQTTLDALERALNKTKTQHEELNTKLVVQFEAELDKAVGGASAAVAFFEVVGGKMPAPPDDLFKELRKDRDKKERAEITAAFEAEVSYVCLSYCQLVRYAYRSVKKQDNLPGSPEWKSWLTRLTKDYGRLHGSFLAGTKVVDGPPVKQYDLGRLFKEKDEGSWTLDRVPDLYRQYIITPLFEEKSKLTGEAWDVYIAAVKERHANEEFWQNTQLPRLQFQKLSQLFEISPSQMGLTELVRVLEKFPQHPDFAGMQSKAEQYLVQLKTRAAKAAEVDAPPGPTTP